MTLFLSNPRLRRPKHYAVVIGIVVCGLLPHISLAVAQQPEVVVREIFGELLSQLDQRRQADTLTRDGVREVLVDLLHPRIDYPALSRWILRDHWVNASEKQRAAFRIAFQNYIINTYALTLAGEQGVQLDVQDNPLLRKNAAVVSADFRIAGSEAIPLQFRLINRNEKWFLFDVSLSGVSLARTFRSDFNYVAREGGIDAVTAHLTQLSSTRQQ